MNKLSDQLRKLNWIFFIVIIVLVVLLFIATSLKYILVQTKEVEVKQGVTNVLNVTILENTIQKLYGEPRPIIVVEAKTKLPSVLVFDLVSKKYNISFTTQGHTNSFEKLFFISPKAHSTEFQLTVSARDKKGNLVENKQKVKTKKLLSKG